MLKIDADALFRAITATGYKLLAYNLDVRTGEIVSRTLAPDEVSLPPEAPSVKPLPKMGGVLEKPKALFDPPAPASKPKLFNDDDTKKPAFGGDFWKRDDKKKPGPFGEFKRESGSKKLAELFGEAPKPATASSEKKTSSATSGAKKSPPPSGPASSTDPYYPRVPAVSEETQLNWMRAFAKDAGDPLIREELLLALHGAKPAAAFERVLRHHLRSAQQWERHLRKQALASAEAWLATLGIEWELIEQDTAK